MHQVCVLASGLYLTFPGKRAYSARTSAACLPSRPALRNRDVRLPSPTPNRECGRPVLAGRREYLKSPVTPFHEAREIGTPGLAVSAPIASHPFEVCHAAH